MFANLRLNVPTLAPQATPVLISPLCSSTPVMTAVPTDLGADHEGEKTHSGGMAGFCEEGSEVELRFLSTSILISSSVAIRGWSWYVTEKNSQA